MGISLVLKSIENRDRQQQLIIKDLKNMVQKLTIENTALKNDVELYKNKVYGGKQSDT